MKAKKKSEGAGKKRKITAKMTFAEIVQKYPEAVKILSEKGMSCIGCPMAMQETLQEGAAMHGINIKKLLAELNKVVNKTVKRKK